MVIPTLAPLIGLDASYTISAKHILLSDVFKDKN